MPSNLDDEKGAKEGTLYVVSTPIGNLADISLRALDTLRTVNLIAAEDTRHTRKLLSYYDIHKPLISYHEHNARQRGGELIEKIASGQSVALVTDAGTPSVSDPGRLLIEAALERGIEPVAIPGATALISALVVSGLSTQPFVFLGFPPARGAERRRFFEKNARLEMTLVLYESPRRLTKTLRDMLGGWGERRITGCIEALTSSWVGWGVCGTVVHFIHIAHCFLLRIVCRILLSWKSLRPVCRSFHCGIAGRRRPLCRSFPSLHRGEGRFRRRPSSDL